LLHERYLEEDSKFYESVTQLPSIINSINHYLSGWQYDTSKTIEAWFLEKEKLTKDIFKQNQKIFNDIHQKLLLSH